MGLKLILEEYVKGIDPKQNGIPKRTVEEEKILENVLRKMNEYYQWDTFKSFLWTSSQNCSDMLIQIGKT